MINVRRPRLLSIAGRLGAALCAGLLAAACSAGTPNATPPKATPSAGHSSTTTTTTVPTNTTLPECGATRDPLDPTGSSGADC